MTTIAEAISRIRTSIKAVKEDSFLTDRTIYFSISKYAKTLIKREDNQFKLMKMSQIFKVLPYVELINVCAYFNKDEYIILSVKKASSLTAFNVFLTLDIASPIVVITQSHYIYEFLFLYFLILNFYIKIFHMYIVI